MKRMWPALLIALLAAPVRAQDVLVVGVFPRHGHLNTLANYAPLADYLTAALKRPVKLESAPDLVKFWEQVASQRYALVHMNQYHYLKAHKLFGYEPIVMNMEFGRATLSGALITRKDGLEDLQQLKGATIVFGGGPDSMQGYILPKYMLMRAGIAAHQYTERVASNQSNALKSVAWKQGDAATAGDSCFLQEPSDTSAGLRFLAKSEPLPHLPWAVSPAMSAAERARLKAALLAAAKAAPTALARAGLTGFAPARDSDYDRHRRIVAEVLGELY